MLVGTTGAGKTTFARAQFRTTEVLSSDFFRGLVSDNEDDQAANDDAFDALHYVAGLRLRAGRICVIDATNVHPETRLEWVALARNHKAPAVAIVLDTPPRICRERNETRTDRRVTAEVLRGQRAAFTRSLHLIRKEGFAGVYVFTPEEFAGVVVESVPAEAVPSSENQRRS